MSALTAPSLFNQPDIPADFTLSDDQDKAAKRIVNFLLDPEQRHLILKGYAGTGKSTLLKHVFDSLPRINELSVITGGENTNRKLHLTATTNKAAGALRQTTGKVANTIHSELGLTLSRDPNTHKQTLITTDRTKTLQNALVIIDEAYMADTNLLKLIAAHIYQCKVLWVGDPAQLLPVGMSFMPLIAQGFASVELQNVIRQAADSPIIQLATLCRHAVETGNFFKFRPDGDIIKHVKRDVFAKMMLESFDEHYGTPGAVKVLAWTNKATQGWNGHVKQTMKGSMDISIGDYVVCNSAIRTKDARLSTDQTVQITGKTFLRSEEDVHGHVYEMDGRHHAFMPDSLDEKRALMKALRKDGSETAIRRHNNIEDSWVDLRDEYACTINKSQGSTYGTTYIDLDDIGRCNMPNQLARLLYVATSRPRDKIVFTGDIQ